MSNVIQFPGTQPESEDEGGSVTEQPSFEDWVYARVPDFQDRASSLTDIALDEGVEAFRAEARALAQLLNLLAATVPTSN